MRTLVVGATGYVGSRIAARFAAAGHKVCGLARSTESARKLTNAGVAPVEGDLATIKDWAPLLHDVDNLAFAATVPFEDEQTVLGDLVEAFRADGRSLQFISGSGVVSTPARDGAWNDYTAAEDDPYPFPPPRNRKVRLGTEHALSAAATDGFRTAIIRPPLIWGHGGSIQVPQFFESARRTGTVCYLGQGLNLYSHAHVDDVADVTFAAFERGSPGRVFHVVAGEVNFRTIAEAVGKVTGCPTRSLTYDEAVDLWGPVWVDLGLAVNSRIRGPRTRAELDWAPNHFDLIEDIRSGSYRRFYEAAQAEGGLKEYSWSAHG